MLKTTYLAALAIATIALPFQIWPAMPLPGMQLSDIFFALSFALYLVAERRALEPLIAFPLIAFGAGAGLSAILGGGTIKLLGHFELAAIAWMTASLSCAHSVTIRKSLVAAASIAAITAAGAIILFYFGIESFLLNHHGDLVQGDYPRARGTLVRANMMSALVAAGLALLWFENQLVPWKILRWVIYLIGSVALLFSFSRTLVSCAIVFTGIEIWRHKMPVWTRLIWFGLSLLAVGALWISIRYHIVLNPMSPWTIKVTDADGSRFALWRQATGTLLANPLFGIGPGHTVANGLSAHNTWINLIAGNGIIPFIAFAWLILSATSTAIKVQMIGAACALMVSLIDSFSKDIEDMRHIWLLIGLALGAGTGALQDISIQNVKNAKR